MEKVIVGLSGGVDSSVTSYILKKEGYEVIAVTLQVDKKHQGEIAEAKKVADSLKIKHVVLDVSEDFENIVIKDFLDGYSSGTTPSPCVVCDEKIKMKTLIDYADSVGARYVATGHYCNLEYSPKMDKYLLKNAVDIRKDQTYMLYRLEEDTLKRMKFPLYNFTKVEVREMAKKIGLVTHNKKDSQGICFAPEGYKEYLQEKLKDKIEKGNFVDEDGNIMGIHDGYQLYTIGQRRGLNLKKPRPYFILDIRPSKNEILLGDYDKLFIKDVELIDYKFVVEIDKLLEVELMARPRFSSHGFMGRLKKVSKPQGKDRIYFEYREKNPQNAKGQHMVLYYGKYLIGGGVIG
ncbi:MAG: tRNA 2-thiouridine(34) synthase MnmA [Psychrilyobacter sp.]|uniref:tRNA 2-thiouridine(34) synthase MnmA n=1 Tax=Psychrilyobacter sp. TaxID=2586924 RepID=UPI003C70AEB9